MSLPPSLRSHSFLLRRSISAFRPAIAHCRPPPSARITLSLQTLRHASKKAKPISKAPTKPGTRKHTTTPVKPPEPIYQSLDERLGLMGKDTLLYANYPTGFLVGCYGISGLGLAWIGWEYYANIHDPSPGTHPWAVKATWVGIALMAAFVGWTGFFPARVIQKIYAHPIPASGNRPASISIILHRRPLLPLMPMKRIRIDSPGMLILDKPFHSVQKPVVGPIVPDTSSLGMKAVRKVRDAPWALFDAVRGLISTRNFTVIAEKDGGSWMLHNGGWVWERRGLDRLFGLRKYRL